MQSGISGWSKTMPEKERVLRSSPAFKSTGNYPTVLQPTVIWELVNWELAARHDCKIGAASGIFGL